MLPAGLDLGRRRIEVCLLSSEGEIVDEWASPPDADGLRGLAARAAMWTPAVRGVIESLNGARLVHDRLGEHGWDVLIADATKGSGAWRRWPIRPTRIGGTAHLRPVDRRWASILGRLAFFGMFRLRDVRTDA